MDTEGVEVELLDPLEQNRPVRLPGYTGSQLSPHERRERRIMGERVVTSGMGEDVMRMNLFNKFPRMTEAEATAVIREARDRLMTETAVPKPMKKASAERRIASHIMSASKRGNWNAVAILEKTLATIQGTEEPAESIVHIDARLTQATLTVLGGITPEQLQELVASEAKLLPAK